MKTRLLVLLALPVFLLSTMAHAGVIVPIIDTSGNDSGWDAVIEDDIHTGIVTDSVVGDRAVIEITKIFHQAPEDGYFSPNSILFRQRLDDAQTAATIVITDEAITNNTGTDWTDYHWQVGCTAEFDVFATTESGFSIFPFTNRQFDCDGKILDVDGGTVADGSTFYPGLISGGLFIDVDLDKNNSDFCLTQYPTPEPGTMILLSLGGAGILFRRKR